MLLPYSFKTWGFIKVLLHPPYRLYLSEPSRTSRDKVSSLGQVERAVPKITVQDSAANITMQKQLAAMDAKRHCRTLSLPLFSICIFMGG